MPSETDLTCGDVKSRDYRAWLLALLCFTGLWTSARMLTVQAGAWSLPGSVGLLDVSCGLDGSAAECKEVLQHRISSWDVTLGPRRFVVPASITGVAYFSFLLLLFLTHGAMSSGPCRSLASVAIVTGLFASVIFVGAMAYSPNLRCSSCLTAHLINGLIGASALSWRRKPASQLRSRSSGWAPAATGATLITAASWFYFDALKEAQTQWRKSTILRTAMGAFTDDEALIGREFQASTHFAPMQSIRNDSVVNDDRPSLVVFFDYHSSRSACLESRLSSAEGNGLGAHYRVVRIPMSEERLNTEREDFVSVESALAARAVMQSADDPIPFARNFFRRSWRKKPVEMALAHGVDAAAFAAAYDAAKRQLKVDESIVHQCGVRELPAMFVDGVLAPNLCLGSAVFFRMLARGQLQDRRLTMNGESALETRNFDIP